MEKRQSVQHIDSVEPAHRPVGPLPTVGAVAWACASLFTTLALVGPALAQSTPAAATPSAPAGAAEKRDAKADDPGASPQTVVVTANKRSERLREVAGTISVLQGGDLESKGVRDHEDLFRLTPGVQYNKAEGDSAVITIRGIGTSTSVGNFVQSTTGFYLEDVPFNDPFIFRTSPDVAAFDLDRVEVLRGPQGVLYGSSSMGGAVRYLFNKPEKAFGFSALGSLSSTSSGGTNHAQNLMLNVPLGETTAARMVLFNRREAGVIDNSTLGLKNTNDLAQKGGRVLVSANPTPQLSIVAMLLTQTTEVDDSSNVTNLATLSKNVAGLSPRKSQFDLGSLQVGYDFGGLRLTSLTGSLKKAVDSKGELSRFAAFYGAGAFVLVDERSKAVSQELRLANTGDGALQWQVGAFYQRFVYDQNDSVQAPAFGFAIPSLIDSTAKETSLFAQVDYRFDSGLTVGLGGRAFKTQNDVVSNVAGTAGTAASSENGFTPRLTAKYKLGGDNLLYGVVSRGYRFGGVNINKFVPNSVNPSFVTPGSYKSDALTNYELGIRLEPAKDLLLDATLFVMDWKDLQLQVPRPGDSFPYTDNVARARSQGLELSANWKLTRDVSLASAAAFTDAKTRAPYASPLGVVPSGVQLPGAAKFQLSNQATWRFAGPMGSNAAATVSHSYVGKSFNDLYKTQEQGGYHLLDLNLAMNWSQWELSLFARNLANKVGKAGVVSATGFYTDYYVTRPRTLGVSLRYDM
jgi:iron complex outermembrane receptor protein